MNETKIKRIEVEFRIMDAHDLKPNYAAMARKYDLDYRTVKKYYEGYKGKPRNRNKGSRLDKYEDLIRTKMKIPRISRKGVYEFLIDEYGFDEIGSYSNFKAFCKKKKISPKGRGNGSGGGSRFETDPGDLAEVDWKENISLTSKNGEEFIVNLFHLVLKFSRYSYIELTLSKEQSILFRCFINSFKYYGGIPKRILFDNMSTAVDTTVRPKRINTRMVQFARDMNFMVETCKARHAYTKGTNEARNKILDWIRAYDGEFDNYEDLIRCVDRINQKMNLEVCEGTDMPPALLFYKEKEYLNPIVCTEIMDGYIAPAKVKVSAQQLISYKGIKYSVDKKYIDEYVQPEEFNDRLHIYYKGKLIQIHQLSPSPINYLEEHYRQTLAKTVKQENMDEIVNNNLRIMDKILESRQVEITREKAVESREGIVAYLLSGNPSSNYTRRYIESLDGIQRKIFYEEFAKLLPCIDDEKEFFNILKYVIKDTNDVKKIRMNFYLQEILGCSTFLTQEGMNDIYMEFKDEIEFCLNETRKGWEQ